MNKQQLASKIWESANKMRSKIEANEYKDYILGFVFYKFLSEKEEKYLFSIDWTQDDLKELNENDLETVENVRKNIGYFISYDNLFSTWLKKGSDFSVEDVRDALSAFSRFINPNHKKVFEGIFDTLQTGLSKLGDTALKQSKAISDLIQLIKDIPMDGKQDYDVLGFIYEYLIEKFAANAGKKAGEFYTPHEVSLLMSEIVANHLKDRDTIEIYDPTSGSGSLLINIGKSISKYIDGNNKIKYYAQELKQNTYNLTRMNLIMRGIEADNIETRNGDTLEDDWPFFDENDPVGTYNPLYVDSVVSNPPYSQDWVPKDKETDARYAGYGLAPKSKADYAFLLHDLYHLKPDGIMTIVLPHGVLFRGGEEGEIRKNLIEKNKIDAIIGLPANIFFGTGIPTIIMVLKQSRQNEDVLIIDASKGFIKEGKNNKLRACDIKKIVDTVVKRETIEKFSKVVSRKEIRENEYNLNIPRYVDSSEEIDSWDIYASMYGGIPLSEISRYEKYWKAFPTLKYALFEPISDGYCKLKDNNISEIIDNNCDVKKFIESFEFSFKNTNEYMSKKLIDNSEKINIQKAEVELAEFIFEKIDGISLVDKYEAFQLLDNEWLTISTDLEMIQTEGLDSTKIVDPNLVIKKKDNKEQEVQEGWRGHIIPFEIVQETILKDELLSLRNKENKFEEIESSLVEIIDNLDQDDKEHLLNDDNDAFVKSNLDNKLKEIQQDIITPEIEILLEYSDISAKKEKIAFIQNHQSINWDEIGLNKDGICNKKEVNNYIKLVRCNMDFDENSIEFFVTKASNLLKEEKTLKKEIKKQTEDLHLLTKDTIESLSDEDVKMLLEKKWIDPLINGINEIPSHVVNDFTRKIEELSRKYEITLPAVDKEILSLEKELSIMIDELEGNEFDMKGLQEFKNLLGGYNSEK